MGWSESERGCKRHPSMNRSPGVCSSCLRERLSQLSDSSNSKTTTFKAGTGYAFFSSSSTAYSNSNLSSRGASPARGKLHHRNASEMMGSISLFFSVGGGGGGGAGSGGLKKSRSIAFVPRRSVVEHDRDHHGLGEGKSGKKKRGFWSKLLGNTGKRYKEVKNLRGSFRI